MYLVQKRKAIKDFVKVSKKLCNKELDSSVFGGSLVDRNHFLVMSKIMVRTRWYKPRCKNYATEKSYRIGLLEEHSIKD